MTSALAALPDHPVHAQARDRLLAALASGSSTGELATIVQSDAGLAVAALRAANRALEAQGVCGAASAVEALGPRRLGSIVSAVPVFESLSHAGSPAERVRFHTVAVQRAAERLLLAVGGDERDEVMTATLLHDIGKLALSEADAAYRLRSDRPPLERLQREREEHGVDHPTVGAELARHWGLPERLVTAIEEHHSLRAEGLAAFVRLADMLAHYEQGAPIDLHEVEAAVAVVGLSREQVGTLLYELPFPVRGGRQAEPCPLSLRELTVLRRLSEGKVYKQIASDEGLAPSTVRNYLSSAYSKLGVADRAQAVLIAADRGWI